MKRLSQHGWVGSIIGAVAMLLVWPQAQAQQSGSEPPLRGGWIVVDNAAPSPAATPDPANPPNLFLRVACEDGRPIDGCRFSLGNGRVDDDGDFLGKGPAFRFVTAAEASARRIGVAGVEAGLFSCLVAGNDGFGGLAGELVAGADGSFGELTIPYRRGTSRIRGYALEADGRPTAHQVAIAPLGVNEQISNPRATEYLWLELTAKVDKQGGFVSQPLPPGRYRVGVSTARTQYANPQAYMVIDHRADADSSLTVQASAVVYEPGRGDPRIVGPPLETRVQYVPSVREGEHPLPVRVIDQYGQPVRRYRIKARIDRTQLTPADVPILDWGEEGIFTIPNAMSEVYIFVVQNEEGFGYTRIEIRSEPDGTFAPVTVPFIRGDSRITGQILQADGTPYRGPVVFQFRKSPRLTDSISVGYNWRAQTDEQGRFASPILPPGDYEITAGEPRLSKQIEHATGRDTEVVLQPGSRQVFRGRVVDRAGQPVEGAMVTVFTQKVYAQDPETSWTTLRATDAQGQWSLEAPDPVNPSRGVNELGCRVDHPRFSITVIPAAAVAPDSFATIALDLPVNLHIRLVVNRNPRTGFNFRPVEPGDRLMGALREIPWTMEIRSDRARIYPFIAWDAALTFDGYRGELLIPRAPRGVQLGIGPHQNDHWVFSARSLLAGTVETPIASSFNGYEQFMIPREGPETEYFLDVTLIRR
jgi:hypothetical protein